MAVMMPRQNWTDERFEHVEKRLDRMDADIREVRQQVVAQMSENMNRNFIALAMLVVAAVVFF
jgi:tetrahydromethanopterin S-methyltransferase subunit G